MHVIGFLAGINARLTRGAAGSILIVAGVAPGSAADPETTDGGLR